MKLENAQVSVAFRPELGGKMVSLVHRATGHEWLLPPPEPERGYRPATLGAPFEDFDTSGFDECFPTVSACRVDGDDLPDHGELWSRPWDCERHGEDLVLRAECRTRPCVFEKRVRLEGSSVRIDYRLESRAREPFPYLWSSHPLLGVEAGAKIHLPAEVRELYVNWSRDDRLGPPGSSVAWSDALAEVGPPARGFADKLFTGRLTRGWCGLWMPSADASLTFRFDPAAVPYVGLWICQGGWPDRARSAGRAASGRGHGSPAETRGRGIESDAAWPTSRPPKHFTVALEPCSGRPDALDVAIARGEASSLAPGETRTWTLTLTLDSGRFKGDA